MLRGEGVGDGEATIGLAGGQNLALDTECTEDLHRSRIDQPRLRVTGGTGASLDEEHV
nr:hypothetical protein [Pseudonocardia sp. ICBG1142]